MKYGACHHGEKVVAETREAYFLNRHWLHIIHGFCFQGDKYHSPSFKGQADKSSVYDEAPNARRLLQCDKLHSCYSSWMKQVYLIPIRYT